MAAPVQRRSLWGEGALLLLIGLFCVFSIVHLMTHLLKLNFQVMT